jgi:hypothetical protein
MDRLPKNYHDAASVQFARSLQSMILGSHGPVGPEAIRHLHSTFWGKGPVMWAMTYRYWILGETRIHNITLPPLSLVISHPPSPPPPPALCFSTEEARHAHTRTIPTRPYAARRQLSHPLRSTLCPPLIPLQHCARQGRDELLPACNSPCS